MSPAGLETFVEPFFFKEFQMSKSLLLAGALMLSMGAFGCESTDENMDAAPGAVGAECSEKACGESCEDKAANPGVVAEEKADCCAEKAAAGKTCPVTGQTGN